MSINDYEYDVALSFAGEQREYVRKVAQILNDIYGLKVFFDEFEQDKLWGKNLYDYLHEIYSQRAKYVIIFVSKEYKEKVWTNHERQAAQERALREKGEYILPVKFDDTKIPGLPDTVSYLDANKNFPEDIARFFAKKYGILEKDRWFGIWEREPKSRKVFGTLNIYKVTEEGFYFDLLVFHGSHMGEFENEFAKFIDKHTAKFKQKYMQELCEITFRRFGDKLLIQEENCRSFHGMRAYFDGTYQLKKDFFYNFEEINDYHLSELYELLYGCYEEFEMCFSDYRVERKGRKFIIFGKVPGMYMEYNGILIIDGNEIRGSFVNINLGDKTIYWFATDNKLDEEIKKWKNENKQFVNFRLKKVDNNLCKEENT